MNLIPRNTYVPWGPEGPGGPEGLIPECRARNPEYYLVQTKTEQSKTEVRKDKVWINQTLNGRETIAHYFFIEVNDSLVLYWALHLPWDFAAAPVEANGLSASIPQRNVPALIGQNAPGIKQVRAPRKLSCSSHFRKQWRVQRVLMMLTWQYIAPKPAQKADPEGCQAELAVQ